jgi:MoxR-like ATPase
MDASKSLLRPLGVFGYDEVEPVILAALVTEDPLLLIGRPGTGKTYLLNSLSEALGLAHRHYNASLISFDDLVGFPYPQPDVSGVRFLETPATVWPAESVLVDELNRCRPEHQNRFFSLIHERRLQGIRLEKLRYRWAAMNPTGGDTHSGCLGAEPLDAALADRFAFVVNVADWEDLSRDDRRAVADPSGEGVIAADGGRLAQFIGTARAEFLKRVQKPPETVLDYATAVATHLGESGVRLSPRRVRQLARNLLGVSVVSPAPGEAAFRLALEWSLPQRATGEAPDRSVVAAAHRATWSSLMITDAEKWLYAFHAEPELAGKIGRLLKTCPDPDTGTLAVTEFLAKAPTERAIAFSLALFPALLVCPEIRVGAEGLHELGRFAVPALHVESFRYWRDPGKSVGVPLFLTSFNTPDELWRQYAAVLEPLARYPRHHARSSQLFARLHELNLRIQEPEKLEREFNRAVALLRDRVPRLTQTESKRSRKSQTKPKSKATQP